MSVMLVDYALVIESVFVVVSLYFLFRYGLAVRRLISEQRDAGDIVGSIMKSIDGKIDRHNERIIDLLYRIDLLEAKQTLGDPHVLQTRNVNNIHENTTGDITSMEMSVLDLLLAGSKSPIEVQRVLGKSREHVARIMKKMFESGYVERDVSKKPFVYRLTDSGRSLIIVVKGS